MHEMKMFMLGEMIFLVAVIVYVIKTRNRSRWLRGHVRCVLPPHPGIRLFRVVFKHYVLLIILPALVAAAAAYLLVDRWWGVALGGVLWLVLVETFWKLTKYSYPRLASRNAT